MVENSLIDGLLKLGLSVYEARAYLSLLDAHPATAYEIAKNSGIPTSKIYEVLSRLVEKKIVLRLEQQTKTKYLPLQPDEFMETYHSRVQENLADLKGRFQALRNKPPVSYIWNIREYSQLIDKAIYLFKRSQKNILLSVYQQEFSVLKTHLRLAVKRGVKCAVVLFGKEDGEAKGLEAVYYHPIEDTLYAEKNGRGFTMVSDSREAVTATIVTADGAVDGAFSNNLGFVSVAEDYIKHDVYIMKIVNRFNPGLIKTFGENYILLRDIYADKEINS